MIFLKETVDAKREVWFALADVNNSANPVEGFNFIGAAAGFLKLRAPAGVLVNYDPTRVVEIGGGAYVYRLADADVANAGSGILVLDNTQVVAVPDDWGFDVVDPKDFVTPGGNPSGTALPVGPITLTGLISIVRTRGDYQSSLTFTDLYITHEIQAAWAELYELVADTNEGWWDKSSMANTIAGQSFIALPGDCWRVQGIDVQCGSEFRPLRQINMRERDRYGTLVGEVRAFRLSVRGAELFPTPNAILPLRFSYTPIVTTLDDSGIQLFGWEEYIITGALLRLDQREERPTQERQVELERCKQRVIVAASRRKQSEPEYLTMGGDFGGEEDYL